jgi:hypothetical protein
LGGKALLQAPEIVGEAETVVRQGATGINECYGYYLPGELGKGNEPVRLVGQREIRNVLAGGQLAHRWVGLTNLAEQLQAAGEHRFVLRALVLVKADILGMGILGFHHQVKSTILPSCKPSSAFSWSTGIGMTMASMYPGISGQEATKFR